MMFFCYLCVLNLPYCFCTLKCLPFLETSFWRFGLIKEGQMVHRKPGRQHHYNRVKTQPGLICLWNICIVLQFGAICSLLYNFARFLCIFGYFLLQIMHFFVKLFWPKSMYDWLKCDQSYNQSNLISLPLLNQGHETIQSYK